MHTAFFHLMFYLRDYFVLGIKTLIKLRLWSEVKSLSHARLYATPWTVACIMLLRLWNFPGKSTGVGCHFLLQGIFPTQGSNPGLPHCRQTLYRLSYLYMYESESEVAQLCPTLCDPMDCSLPGSSVHGIFQARILEWKLRIWVLYKARCTSLLCMS